MCLVESEVVGAEVNGGVLQAGEEGGEKMETRARRRRSAASDAIGGPAGALSAVMISSPEAKKVMKASAGSGMRLSRVPMTAICARANLDSAAERKWLSFAGGSRPRSR